MLTLEQLLQLIIDWKSQKELDSTLTLIDYLNEMQFAFGWDNQTYRQAHDHLNPSKVG